MPAGNRQGPQGMGPSTGRGAGLCAGFPEPGYVSAGRGFGRGRGWGGGFGRGRGRGGGFGRRHGSYATGPGWPPAPTADQELELLRRQADLLESTLEDVRSRLQQLESQQRSAESG